MATQPGQPKATQGRKKGKGKALSRATRAPPIGLGRPPVARAVSPTSPSPSAPRMASEARKRRRAEADVEGDESRASAVETIIAPAPTLAHFTRHVVSAEPTQTQSMFHVSDEDVEMNELPTDGDEGDLDTYRMLRIHNVDPYDLRSRHLPPPVDAPCEPRLAQAAIDTASYDPAAIRARETAHTSPRLAPPHLINAYRTEVDDNGIIRPRSVHPPTRRPASQPIQSGEFGNGRAFDREAFHAATFHAPPFQLRSGNHLGGIQQGTPESPSIFASGAREHVPEPTTHAPNHASTPAPSFIFGRAPAESGQPTQRDVHGSFFAPLRPRAEPVREVNNANAVPPTYLPPRAPTRHSTYRQQGAWHTAAIAPGPQLGSLTPAPREGWRLIQGDTPLWKFANQNADQVSAWLRSETPSCLAHIPGQGATDEGRWVTRGLVESVMRQFFGTNEINVTLPTPAIAQLRSNAAPWFYEIQAKDTRIITAMLSYVWMSMAELTIGFLRLDLDPPTLIASFQDIHAFVATTELGIADIVVDALLAMSDIIISLIIDDLAHDGRWQSFSAIEAFDNILHSVRVRIVPRRIRGDIIDPVALIYCQSPTADTGGWEAFRHHVQYYPFGSTHSGRPQPCSAVLWCALCHSHDHPTGLCYLPATPMWHGPSIADVLPAAATRGTTRGRGGGRRAARGAGRGRGSRGRGF